MKLYISDQHFFHERVMNLDKRNFHDLKEMHAYMIEKWNAKVKGGDQVIVLGDMFFTTVPEEVNSVLNRLNGKICLVEGNHDKWIKKQGVNLNRFEWIRPYAELQDGERLVVASHYPTFCYNHQFLKCKDGSDRTFMLYGHVHDTHDELLVNEFVNLTKGTVLHGSEADRRIPCNMINCFCKYSDYEPLSLDEWIALDEKRRAGMEKRIDSSLNIADEL